MTIKDICYPYDKTISFKQQLEARIKDLVKDRDHGFSDGFSVGKTLEQSIELYENLFGKLPFVIEPKPKPIKAVNVGAGEFNDH